MTVIMMEARNRNNQKALGTHVYKSPIETWPSTATFKQLGTYSVRELQARPNRTSIPKMDRFMEVWCRA